MIKLKMIITADQARKLIIRWTAMSPLSRQMAQNLTPWVKPSDIIGYRRYRNQHRFVGASGSSARISTRKVKSPVEREIMYLEYYGHSDAIAWHMAGMTEFKNNEVTRLITDSGEIEVGMRNVLWRNWGDWKLAVAFVKKCFSKIADSLNQLDAYRDSVTTDASTFIALSEEMLRNNAENVMDQVHDAMQKNGIFFSDYPLGYFRTSDPLTNLKRFITVVTLPSTSVASVGRGLLNPGYHNQEPSTLH